MSDRAVAARPKPIRHHVVVGHPSPASFCRSAAEAYCAAVQENGQEAVLQDLYSHGFDPALKPDERPGPNYRLHADVAAELERVRLADILVLVYPTWFGSPPAMMKGYVDRVMGANFGAENLPRNATSAMLGGKRLVIIATSGTTRPWLEERGQFAGLHQAFDLYLADIFGMTGPDRMHFDAIVPDAKGGYIQECLEALRERTREICAKVLSERHAAHTREVLRLRA